MLETIKTVGSFAGLATLAFTIWDRWLRGRPTAGVTGAIRTTGMPPEPYIRILNPGPTDVLIQRVRVRPTIYGVAKDYSRRGRQAFFEGADVNVLLRPGQEHELPIIDLRNEENKNVSQRVCFCIYWRKTSSNWLPQAPVTVRSSTRVIEQIVAATPQQD